MINTPIIFLNVDATLIRFRPVLNNIKHTMIYIGIQNFCAFKNARTTIAKSLKKFNFIVK